jgi:hypothetical protein
MWKSSGGERGSDSASQRVSNPANLRKATAGSSAPLDAFDAPKLTQNNIQLLITPNDRLLFELGRVNTN